MKVQHFKDTDTVYIQFTDNLVTDTQELNENTLLDLDKDGNLVAVTVEHASTQASLSNFHYEQLPAAA